jgi:hypothetical protein
VRRLHDAVAHEAIVWIPLVIRDDEDDVGLRIYGAERRNQDKEGNEKAHGPP